MSDTAGNAARRGGEMTGKEKDKNNEDANQAAEFVENTEAISSDADQPGATKECVRVSVDLTQNLYTVVSRLAQEGATTKSAVIRAAIEVVRLVADGRKKGRVLALVKEMPDADTMITGLPF